MKLKPMFLALVAMIIGLVTAISIGRKPGDANAESQETASRAILVTAVDMDAGLPLGPQTVRLTNWPHEDIPEGAYQSIHDIQSRYALRRMQAGEPVTSGNTTESITTALEFVPAGYRMCVIHTSLTPSLQAAMRPGCRVDVLVYLPQSLTVPVPTTRRVATAARVHSHKLESDPDDTAAAQDSLVPCVVTLLVKQEEVQPLLLAAENGMFRLSLVGNPADADTRQDDYTYQQLVASLPVRGNPPLVIRDKGRQHPTRPPTGEADVPTPPSAEETAAMIDKAVAEAVSSALAEAEKQSAGQLARLVAEADAEAEARAAHIHWTMDIFTPTGVTQYRWKTPDSAPLVMVADHRPEVIAGLQTSWNKIETALRDDQQAPPRK
jgi:Flp pilus assembly protein CpaB